MTRSVVATRYANALADVVTAASSPVRPPQAVADLLAFQAALDESYDLHTILLTPAVPMARKRVVVQRIADRLQLTRVSRNFLMVLIDHRRIGAISEIVDAFETVIDSRLGFARANVTSAGELTEPQRQALSIELERLTGKKIRARFGVDQALIGGVVARIGSTVYDGSVRDQLQTIERRLSAES